MSPPLCIGTPPRHCACHDTRARWSLLHYSDALPAGAATATTSRALTCGPADQPRGVGSGTCGIRTSLWVVYVRLGTGRLDHRRTSKTGFKRVTLIWDSTRFVPLVLRYGGDYYSLPMGPNGMRVQVPTTVMLQVNGSSKGAEECEVQYYNH